MTDPNTGSGNYNIGDINNAQGIAIGPHANAQVTGSNIGRDVKVDAQELRSALEDLYKALGQAQLPFDKTISTQTAVGTALTGVKDDHVEAQTVVDNVKKIGDTLKQANTVVEHGSSLWQSVRKLAPLLGPTVADAWVVADWFGIPLDARNHPECFHLEH
jgi:hypothetical protein